MSLKVTVHGARGSLPSPYSPKQVESRVRSVLEGFLNAGHKSTNDVEGYLKTLHPSQYGGYGGNTPCIEVNSEKTQFIIDGGSGIRMVGYDLMKGPCGEGQGEVHLFFTHFHWDHLIGLPFFVPLFVPGNTIHVYAVQPDLPEIFKTLFRKPTFPVALENLGAKVVYHRLEPRKAFLLGDISITPYELDHPDPCWGYRIEHQKKVFAYCVDTECLRVTRQELGPDLPLYQGVDLMIFDAQYTLQESIEKINWGHAAASLGIEIAIREGAKKVLFMHHDPASSDEKVAKAEEQARNFYEARLKILEKAGEPAHRVDWGFATEGMVIKL